MKRVRKSRKSRLTAVYCTLLSLSGLAGCLPESAAPLQYLPEQTSAATLRSASPVGHLAILIKSIDGIAPKLLENQVAVSPGSHLIQVEAEYSQQQPPYSILRIKRSFELVFESGENYACDAKAVGEDLLMWIENSSTGEVVAGEAPGTARR